MAALAISALNVGNKMNRMPAAKWHFVDAKNKVVGRLATQIATVIRGKHKPTYERQWDCGDNVVVVNAQHLRFTGKKLNKKIYYWHTGYPGGIKQETAAVRMQKNPEKVLRLAVQRMIPKNKLRLKQMARLKIFADEEHKFAEEIKDIDLDSFDKIFERVGHKPKVMDFDDEESDGEYETLF